jgi:hypothetical protein
MKKSELRNLIREEIRKLISEKLDHEVEMAIRKNILTAADDDYKAWAGRAKFDKTDVKWKWDLQGGSKFIKIIRDENGQRSVWGFVAQVDGELKGVPFKKGDVFLPAGFNAPAKHSRGSAFKPQSWKWTGPDYL